MIKFSKEPLSVKATAKLSDYAKRLGVWKNISEENREAIGRFLKLHEYYVHRHLRVDFKRHGIETRIRPAVQIFLFRNGPKGVEVYLGKRKAGGFVGQWCPPGGGREEGQTFETAALAEMAQETGLDELIGADLMPIDTHISQITRVKADKEVSYEHHIRAYAVWGGDAHPFNASPDEHEKFDWKPISEWLDIDTAARNGVLKDVDEDTIVHAIPSGALKILKEFEDFGSVSQALEDR